MLKTIFMVLCLIATVLFTVGSCMSDRNKGRAVSQFGFALLATIVVFIIAVM